MLKNKLFSRSNRLPHLKVEENVLKQNISCFDSSKEFREGSFVNIGLEEVGFKDAAFTISKDVISHTAQFLGEHIKLFLGNREVFGRWIIEKRSGCCGQNLVFSSRSKF